MRRALSVVAGVVVALGVAVPAQAHVVVGFTWYSDGATSKTGPSGTVISAYATGAARNTDFKLVLATPINVGHDCVDNRTDVNPNVRRSSDTGFIGLTTGVVAKPPGEWQLCFHSLGGTITYPRLFIVT